MPFALQRWYPLHQAEDCVSSEKKDPVGFLRRGLFFLLQPVRLEEINLLPGL